MSSKQPDLDRGIYVLTHTLIYNGARHTVQSDCISIDSKWYAVFEWSAGTPWVKVELEEAKIGFHTTGYFTYSGDLEDPRRLH